MTTLEKPAIKKLPEGYHFTEKYGEIFVSPGGIAWVTREMPNHELKSVSVPVKPTDIVKTPAVDRLKHAKAVQRSRIRARGLTQPSIFGSGKGKDSKQGTLAGVS